VYLRNIAIHNAGPIRDLHLDLSGAPNVPRPLVLVGQNGSGKTTLLSIVADAFFEAAAVFYQDTTPGGNTLSRPWFRVIGSSTVTSGEATAFSVLQFDYLGRPLFYSEKSGNLTQEEAKALTGEELHAALVWPPEGSHKQFSASETTIEQIFESGVYAFFPSSRAEVPAWLNPASVQTQDFSITSRFNKQLKKPFYVEQGIPELKKWLMSLLIDVRSDVVEQDVYGARTWLARPGAEIMASKAIWGAVNRILQTVLDDPTARFGWGTRRAGGGLQIILKQDSAAVALESLSAGQASLLNIFGTLLRYGDGTTGRNPSTPENLAGICVVDEIDAHMHVDLQVRALPSLIAMFPKIQFVVSSHSPLFVLGVERLLGPERVAIVNMPSGAPIQAEAYEEFATALEVFEGTKAFAANMEARAKATDRPLIMLEGETDPSYLSAACELLGRLDLLEQCRFQWVGAKDGAGQGFNTGKKALDSALALFRARPELVKTPLLLLYDNDTQKSAADYGLVSVACVPTNSENKRVTGGIENLLPEHLFKDSMFQTTVKNQPDGGRVTVEQLRKMAMCDEVCRARRDPADFAAFQPLVDLIDAWLSRVS
jgi:hypothetical protein